MPAIVLTTFNARYIHASFGLRYLRANLGELRDESSIKEFTIHQRPIDVAEAILAESPQIVGIGVYIWNVPQSLELIQILKEVAPEVQIVVGGPEVSHETEGQPIVEAADYVITGQADHAFRELCQALLSGNPPVAAVIHAAVPDPTSLAFPYELYDDEDVAHRVIYVEASRGCPFRCEFCLSSLDRGAKAFDTDLFLAQMERLFERGVRHFKFVDRTFNLRIETSLQIMQFFLDRMEPGLFVHFEMVPDRLPDELRGMIQAFPEGSLQFEVGIQTFNPEVAKRISRRQNYDKLAENFRFLDRDTGVHVHADLIAGLPGESMASFGEGFDRLVDLGPQEIQVGILKRLNGAPIARHTEAHQMRYSAAPPYEILSTDALTFTELQELRRFARYWDLVGNSGNFRDSLELILAGPSAFTSFMSFSRWLREAAGTQHGISLQRLTRYVFEYLVEVREHAPDAIGPLVLRDYQRPGRPKVPKFLLPWKDAVEAPASPRHQDADLPSRQARHATS